MTVMERIAKTYLVPVVVMDDAARAVETAKAMLAGGVDIMEITLRTPAGLDAIQEVAKACPEVLVGAGTVLNLEQCKEAINRGANFIVSPGYDPEIVAYCIDQKINILPGCVTPTEISAARNAGLKVLKFFPANVYGGVKAVKALTGPFPDIRFVPTGGVSLENLAEFVSPEIYAIGGGWLCERTAINSDNYSAITEVCKQSAAVIAACRA